MIVPEAALKTGLLGFSRTLLVVSLIVSAVVGALVYFTIYRLVVKPMQGLTRSLVRFAEAPEGTEIELPTGGTDEMRRARRQPRTGSAVVERRVDVVLAVIPSAGAFDVAEPGDGEGGTGRAA